MERLIVTQAELTGQMHSAYSNGRGNNMPEGSADVAKTSKDIAPLVREWQDELKSEPATPDTDRVVKALVDSGVRPLSAPKSPEDNTRIDQAKKLLDRKELTKEQEEALIKAHMVGEGKIGKSGGTASVGNYTQEQISQKARILEGAGFTKEQRRQLMEAGIIGMYPPSKTPKPELERQIDEVISDGNPDTTIKPDSFINPDLKKIAGKIDELYRADFLTQESLQDLWRQANKKYLEGTGVDVNEARRLEIGIGKIVLIDELRTGRVSARDYSSEVSQDGDYKRRIEEARTAGNRDEEVRLKAERRDFVKALAKGIAPQSGERYDPIFKIIIDEGNSLYYIVDRIISPPLDSETGDWSLGFYGQNNLDTIISLLKNEGKNVEYNSVQELEEAFRLAHTVNKSIINADLKVLEGIAGSVTDQRLNKLSRIKGVGLVTRLLEVEYGSLIARDGWINGKNYAVMFGKSTDPETGLLLETQEQSALISFKDFVASAVARIKASPNDPSITDEMRDLAKLEDWQVLSAFNIGKSIYNMWFRGAEWISEGKVPKGDKGLVSFPQETIARILNWPQWMLQRFEISESRGGMEWLKLVKKAHQANRRHEGYGEMGLLKIGGRDIANFEMPDMVGVRGWWSTWRERQLLMSTIPLQFTPQGRAAGMVIKREGANINPNDIADLAALLDIGALSAEQTGTVAIDAVAIETPEYNGELEEAPQGIQIDYWKSIFLDSNGNLRADLKMGLGACLFFLKPSGGEKNQALDRAKEEIRAKIWQRAAVENPLGVLSYLEGLQYKSGEIVSIIDRTHPTEWRTFERKLFQLNEIKMQKIRGLDKALAGKDPHINREQAIEMIRNITLAGIIAEERGVDSGIKLDATEMGWLNAISEKGQRAARDLANVRFEYNPFLNDAPMEKLDYSVIGHEGFRRMLNDTGGFSRANEALIEVMDNPSKHTKPEEIFEPLLKFISGTGNILGTETGQKKGWLWLRTTMAFYERGGNASNALEKRLRQLPFVNEALHLLHSPNSLAQKYAGPEAANWDMQQLYKAGEQAVHMGLLTEHLHEEWKKRFGGRRATFLIQLLRAIFAGIFVGVLETGKAGSKDVDALGK